MNDQQKKPAIRRRTALLLAILLLMSKFSFAVDVSPVKMDDALWSNGKIYVVVLVVLTIFLGIILTLIHLERKIKKLEKQVQ
ncbi:MAG TPA: CcmD family protein [Edaphocola sp.]|nr:CcmD family protein [Edaphocola sp.]